ncbi:MULTISPECIES: hypothetical protein [unclassified Psychrobacillus]|uniref:hypothetical protein n=1 Tax=unclassified Psychrobacillus TaxID=2636677 RepID=UPI0030F80D12
MKYEEITAGIQDLMEIKDDYTVVHSISGDARMEEGNEKALKKHFNLFHLTEKARIKPFRVGTCVQSGRVMNLITKKLSWSKPTYTTLNDALAHMRDIAIEKGLQKIAMPQIGAGSERLDWDVSRELILDIFKDTDIEILVYVQ